MWSAIRVERLTSDRFGSGSKEDSISLKQCWTSGTAQRAPSIRFAPTTGISTFFDNKQRRPMECGIWFRFGRVARNADTAVFCAEGGKGVMSEAWPGLLGPSEPDLPGRERQIYSAGDEPRNR